MNPLKGETAVSEVFKYDHVQVDVIKPYMEISDLCVISKLFVCQIKKKKKIYLIASFFEVLAYYNGYIILYQIMILPFVYVYVHTPTLVWLNLTFNLALFLKVSVLVTQLCLTLWDHLVCSLLNSFVHGVLQVRILERVVISFSRDLPNPGIEPRSPALQENSLPTEPTWKLCF